MDLNWFFSTFSQSAAALLGVIAAFIIARLLGLDDRIAALKYDFDGLVVEKKRIEGRLKTLEIPQTINTLIINSPGFFEMNHDGKLASLSDKDQLALIHGEINPLTDEADVLLKQFEKVKIRISDYKDYMGGRYDEGNRKKSVINEVLTSAPL